MYPVKAEKDGAGLGLGEVFDWFPRCGGGLEGSGRLAERDEGDVLGGSVGQERLDGAEPQGDGSRGVALVVCEPGHPGFEAFPVQRSKLTLARPMCSWPVRKARKHSRLIR